MLNQEMLNVKRDIKERLLLIEYEMREEANN
jgi:hypothetical protein